jgi:hypothetical protein
MAVAMKSFWDVMPRSLAEAHRRFVRTYCLHLQDRKAFQTTNKKHAVTYMFGSLQHIKLLTVYFFPLSL